MLTLSLKLKQWQPKPKDILILSVILIIIASIILKVTRNTVDVKNLYTFTDEELKYQIEQSLMSTNTFPKMINKNGKNYKLRYSIKNKLEAYVEKLLKRYRSDYSAVVIIDNNTNEILTATGYDRKRKKIDKKLAFSSTHPAASLFKIVTSAELLQNTEVDINSSFTYRGKSTTLYKYQLKDRITKWVRNQTLKSAFAISNNAIFGKAAIKNINGTSIYKMATKFGFNIPLMEEVRLNPSIVKMPHSQYNLAELASGFNRETLMSPIHAALIPSIVVNDGKLKYPKLVKMIESDNKTKVAWRPNKRGFPVIDPSVARGLSEMMSYTVERGTAKSSFRRFLKKNGNKLIIGGKTGTITGGKPFGQRDWFTAFARPRDNSEDLGISICVMNINIEKWYIKSTSLAKKVIEFYYSKIKGKRDDLI